MIKSKIYDNVLENYHLQKTSKVSELHFPPVQEFLVNINLWEQAIIQLSSHVNYLNVQVIIAFICY